MTHRSINGILMLCLSEHLPSPPGKPQPQAGSTPCWTYWPHRARGCWRSCTGHRPSLPTGDTQTWQRYRRPRIAEHSHGKRFTCSWQVGRNINNLRYADNTTLMAESEELKSLLRKVKEESEKVGLKLNIQKTKIMASGPIPSWQIEWETGNSGWLYFFELQNHWRWWLQSWN